MSLVQHSDSMRNHGRHIAGILAAALMLFTSCSSDEAKVIPRGKLSKIYAEMLMTDQWITSTPGVRQIADTSLVYEPILEEYGYTSADYRKTVDVYLDDPERFAKVLKGSVDILEERLVELRKEKAQQELDELRKKRLKEFEPDFKVEDFFPYFYDEPYVHYHDSVTFECDSLQQMYRLVPVERTDTVYGWVEMTVKADTSAVDTLTLKEMKQVRQWKPAPVAEETSPVAKRKKVKI